MLYVVVDNTAASDTKIQMYLQQKNHIPLITVATQTEVKGISPKKQRSKERSKKSEENFHIMLTAALTGSSVIDHERIDIKQLWTKLKNSLNDFELGGVLSRYESEYAQVMMDYSTHLNTYNATSELNVKKQEKSLVKRLQSQRDHMKRELYAIQLWLTNKIKGEKIRILMKKNIQKRMTSIELNRYMLETIAPLKIKDLKNKLYHENDEATISDVIEYIHSASLLKVGELGTVLSNAGVTVQAAFKWGFFNLSLDYQNGKNFTIDGNIVNKDLDINDLSLILAAYDLEAPLLTTNFNMKGQARSSFALYAIASKVLFVDANKFDEFDQVLDQGMHSSLYRINSHRATRPEATSRSPKHRTLRTVGVGLRGSQTDPRRTTIDPARAQRGTDSRPGPLELGED